MAGSKRSDGPDSTTIPPGLHFVQTRPPLCSIKFYCARHDAGQEDTELADWFTTFNDTHWLLGAKGKDEEAEARFLRRVLRLRRGSQVLDAPCGKGRIAVPLAEAGCRVTAVDLNPRLLRTARRRFTERKLHGTFLVKDLRSLDFDGEFDAAYNWFGSFGYFSDADNLEVFWRYAHALRPGGRLLVEQINRERILRNFRSHSQIGKLAISNRWDRARQRVEGTWTWQERGRQKTSRSSIRIYTPSQMVHLFEKVGFSVENVSGDARSSSFRRSSDRLIVIGRKL